MMFHFSNQNWSEFPLTADKFINWIDAKPKRKGYKSVYEL